MAKNKHAVALGKLGGAATTPAKVAASRANGQKGGRPLRYCEMCDRWVGKKACPECGAETVKADKEQ